MEKTNDVVGTIGQIMGDEAFIYSLMEDMDGYISDVIERKLATVIKYYIATRDSNIDYTYQEIENRYSKIKDVELEPDTELYINIVTHGFFTHSFNGYKKDRIMSYGLNYMGNIQDEETLRGISKIREMFQALESILGQSKYLSESEHFPNEIYIASPGTKTIFYACQNAPERLYQGPLKGYDKEPIVVGETKQTYMLRYLRKKIQQKYPNIDSLEHIQAVELAKAITEYFCSKQPAVVFLRNEQIKDIPVSERNYEPDDAETLDKYIKRWMEENRTLEEYVIKKFRQGQRYRLKETGEDVIPVYEDKDDEVITTGYEKRNGEVVPMEEVELYTCLYDVSVPPSSLKPRIIGYKLKGTGKKVEPITQVIGSSEEDACEEFIEMVGDDVFFTFEFNHLGQIMPSTNDNLLAHLGEEVIIGFRLEGTGEKVSVDSVEAIKDGYYYEKKVCGYIEDVIELEEDEVEPRYRIFRVDDMFTTKKKDENGDLGNVVTLSQFIPDEAMAGVIDVIDEFDMKQIFARNRGGKVGDLIDPYSCKVVGEPTIEQLLDAITPNCTEEDLEEIRNKYEKLRQLRGREQQNEQGLDFDAEFERRMQVAEEAIIARQQQLQTEGGKKFLEALVEKSRERVGLQGIQDLVATMRNVRIKKMKLINPNKEGKQTGK